MIGNALTFACTLPTLLVAHYVADHWIQTAYQAEHKGERTWRGRFACLRHVVSYTLVCVIAVMLVRELFDLQISLTWFVVGQLINAASHYWADRRFTLQRLAERVGLGAFYQLGVPRPDRDDNPSLGTGKYALDQAWHQGWLIVVSIVTSIH